jgi:Flp pilus assembly protein TadG
VRLRDKSRGQSMVEFALVMPLFALLCMGLLDFGRVVFAQNTVTQAAREAARVATLEPGDYAAKYTQIRNKAKSMGVGLGLTDADIVGLSCADCFYADEAISGGRVVVIVSKKIDLLTPLLAQAVGGSFTVTSTSQGFIP